MSFKKGFLLALFILIALFLVATIYLRKDEGKVEELLSEKGRAIVVRVLTPSGIPFEPTYAWVYLIKDGNKVFIWDSGTRYSLLIPSFLHCNNPFVKPLKSEEYILNALNKYFPNSSVEAIGLSHWHWDHAENAPFLQKKLGAQILINSQDKTQAEGVFKDACFEGTSLFGENLNTRFKLGSSSFYALETPGHTMGTITLVSDSLKILIVNASYAGCFRNTKKPQEGVCKVLDKYRNYKIYYLHPGF